MGLVLLVQALTEPSRPSPGATDAAGNPSAKAMGCSLGTDRVVSTPGTPPPDFDGSVIGWVGDAGTGATRDGIEDGLWIGNLTGGDLRRLTTEPASDGLLLPDGRVLLRTHLFMTSGVSSLSVIDEPGVSEPRHLAPLNDRYVVAANALTVIVNDFDNHGIDLGVWSVPIDGEPTRILPPVDGLGQDLADLAVSGDARLVTRLVGTSVAAETATLQASWTDAPVELPLGTHPIGFDSAGCLVFLHYPERHLLRRDLATGAEELLVGQHVDQVAVKPSGRWAEALTGSAERIAIVDLHGNEIIEFALEGTHWSLSNLGGDRYVVLERSSSDDGEDRGMIHVVIDVEERWAVTLPPWSER